MNGYSGDIEKETLENQDFRRVLYTAQGQQLVLMSIPPGADIGEETHEDVDQFIRCEAGVGTALLNGVERPLHDGVAVIVPRGVRHNVINTSTTEALKLYSLYSPPEHKDQTVHQTKNDVTEEHFDGKTTE
jgi:mannose-6-phosphate isomerase-like protein (cupin superfamily)